MIVVADTSSLNYLVLLKRVEVLPALYGQVVVPHAVADEMQAKGAPSAVRHWAERLPEWINVVSATRMDITLAPKLGDGEREAISVAMELGADLILMDDYPGRIAAEARGLVVSGTLSVLMRASRRGMLDFEATLHELKALGFRLSRDVEARVRQAR